MKSPNDISSLFKMLGESPEHYQEIVRDVDARESRDRWPLIAAIQASETAQSAPVIKKSSNSLPRREAQAPALAARHATTEQAAARPYPKSSNQLTSLFTRLSAIAAPPDLPPTKKKASIFERLLR